MGRHSVCQGHAPASAAQEKGKIARLGLTPGINLGALAAPAAERVRERDVTHTIGVAAELKGGIGAA